MYCNVIRIVWTTWKGLTSQRSHLWLSEICLLIRGDRLHDSFVILETGYSLIIKWKQKYQVTNTHSLIFKSLRNKRCISCTMFREKTNTCLFICWFLSFIEIFSQKTKWIKLSIYFNVRDPLILQTLEGLDAFDYIKIFNSLRLCKLIHMKNISFSTLIVFLMGEV